MKNLGTRGLFARVGVLASVVGLIAAVGVVAPSPAMAAARDCAGGANGFVDIPDNLSGLEVEQVRSGSHWLVLNFGKVNGVTRGWAMLFASDNGPVQDWLPKESSVWLDWSQDGGRTWLQCGPFYNSKGKMSITSAAKQTSSSSQWVFRAGARDGGVQVLSRWH